MIALERPVAIKILLPLAWASSNALMVDVGIR